jgi:hypothetical protein
VSVRGIGVAVITSICGLSRRLLRQHYPLVDAESVLLVDHHEAQMA